VSVLWTVCNPYTPTMQVLIESLLRHLGPPEDGNTLPKHVVVNIHTWINPLVPWRIFWSFYNYTFNFLVKVLIYQNYVYECRKYIVISSCNFLLSNSKLYILSCTPKHNEVYNTKILHIFDIGMKIFLPFWMPNAIYGIAYSLIGEFWRHETTSFIWQSVLR
jgi:hypothetical protein